MVPVIERLLARDAVPVSVDTQKAAVAEGALGGGRAHGQRRHGARGRAGWRRVRASRGRAGAHAHAGHAADDAGRPAYADLLGEVREPPAGARSAGAEAAGVAPGRVCVDPGIGFGKTVEHNLTLLRRLDALRPLGKPVLVGPSRKRFIGTSSTSGRRGAPGGDAGGLRRRPC